MSKNLMVGSHKYTSKEYGDKYDQIVKKCECGRNVPMGEKCICEEGPCETSGD
jgi:hypothetical protein